jgi:phospholipid-binding lipoprotein MlaA
MLKKIACLSLAWLVAQNGLAVAETLPALPGTPTSQAVPALPAIMGDPYETFNRQVFTFNAWLVHDVVNPAADWLGWILPLPIQQAGYNVYNNLTEPEFIVTNLFDSNPEGALRSGQRFLINSTLGIVGIWDVATWMGYQRREVEFIESLCSAGLDPGAFIVLPAVGPASVYPAALLTGFFAVEWYALAFISSTLATADLVVDLSASAASLRHTRDVPGAQTPDPYVVQREEFMRYLETHCANHGDARS